MEAELTGALKETLKTDNSAVTEEANVDEAITTEANAGKIWKNDINEEQNTKAYEEKMNIDIEDINTFEKINKVYKINVQIYMKSYNQILKGN